MRQQHYPRQYPKFGGLKVSLEEKYIEALGDIDCDAYTHRELCLYLVELVYESLHSTRKLRELENL
jgi:hypothetical protein